MRVVIINKSDSTGGAAVVSFRLMEALREEGVDARMLVAEKLTDSPYVELAAPEWRLKGAFIADRLRIAMANGFDRSSLFKLDAAVAGVGVADHPLVKNADAVLINWVNQGLMSLKDVERIGRTGKRLIWTMHDMWNLTGLCHHAGECRRYISPGTCGNCPKLGAHKSPRDLSFRTHTRKRDLYENVNIDFVAVSSWLADKSRVSSLLGKQNVTVIPNPFRLPETDDILRNEGGDRVRLIFGAARLDDDVKGFPTFIESMRELKRRFPEISEKITVTLYGAIRNASLIERIPFPVSYKGLLRNQTEIRALYCDSDIVVSTSSYETLPGTLVEGQAYGSLPVSFGRGGQRDIIEDGVTGVIVDWNDDTQQRAIAMTEGIIKGINMLCKDGAGLRKRMFESVKHKFDSSEVAKAYLRLINNGR